MATTKSVRSAGDRALYLQAIHALPMLTPEQEVSLARRWHERQELEAVHALVASHLRLVAKIAGSYRGYGLPLDDLIAEGSVGMLQAAKKFDPDRGFRLATYATWWIRASIQDYILRSWSLVKIGTTAAQKKLFFNLRRIKGQLAAIEEGDLSPEHVATIAHRLDVNAQDVVSMNRRLAAPDHSLNAPMRLDGDSEWQDWLVDDRPNPETQLIARREQQDRKASLAKAMDQLTDREKRILTERRLRDKPTTLEDLAVNLGISRERIRQIEQRAFEKLRHAMMKRASPGVRSLRAAPTRSRKRTQEPAILRPVIAPPGAASWIQ
jgi:RNA polymerase sigma-32 factor